MSPPDIKRIRHEAGLSVSQMAELLNFDDPIGNGSDRVREFERGKRIPTGPVLRLLQLIDQGMITYGMVFPDRLIPGYD